MSYLYNSSQNSHTIDKCQKILRMFQEINMEEKNNANCRQCQNPKSNMSSSKTKQNPYYLSQSTAKKFSSKPTVNKSINNSNSKSALKNNNTSTSFFTNQYQSSSSKPNQRQKQTSPFMKRQSSYLMKREKSNSSFVSYYNKESRLDKIMKLKVLKPNINSVSGLRANKKTMILNTSLSSLNSSRSSLNKENVNFNTNNRHKQSRLQKIMNIKVQKPKVNSTLIGYEPRKLQRSLSRSSNNNKKSLGNISSVIELKECKKKQRKSEQIQEKQERLWKIFQRERQQQLKDKKKQQQLRYKQERRQEEKFQKLVQKQLRKIENSREISLRKDKAFSEYVYPTY